MVQALDVVRKLQVMVACVTSRDDKQTNMPKRRHERTFPILAASVVHGPAPRALRRQTSVTSMFHRRHLHIARDAGIVHPISRTFASSHGAIGISDGFEPAAEPPGRVPAGLIDKAYSVDVPLQ
jgi:hypothetical protein